MVSSPQSVAWTTHECFIEEATVRSDSTRDTCLLPVGLLGIPRVEQRDSPCCVRSCDSGRNRAFRRIRINALFCGLELFRSKWRETKASTGMRRARNMIITASHARMHMARLASIAYLLIASFVGCGNLGGGGSVHIPPEFAVFGDDLRLHLDLSSTGMSSGPLNRRYTKLKCHYRSDDGSYSGSVDGNPRDATDEDMSVEFELPAIDSKTACELSYWFTFDFDGVFNKRAGGIVKIVQPSAREK